MSADTVTVGYPPHAVAEYQELTNPHGALFTRWTAVCGAVGTQASSAAFAFGKAGSALRTELCRVCFPAGHRTFVPTPRRLESTVMP